MAQLQPGDPGHVGPYEVVARLTTDEGAASTGRLYLAHYPGAGQVAIRVFAPRLAADDAVRARLSDGVAAARAVTSPSACPLRAAAILREPAPWIAWEYAPGPSLAAVLAGHGRLPEAAVASLAVGLAEALRAIHDAGAVHGDLRPGTVFLTDGKPRVTGYGVAAAVQAAARDGAAPAAPGAGQGAPAAGRVPDSRLFIAPELASGDVLGPAGDMFSLGAVVAFAAGGKGPFGIGGPPGLPYHAPYGVPDLGSVPAALRLLITRCLDADPGWRPTAGEFRSLATTLLPDAAEPAQWPEVEPRPAPPGQAPSAIQPLPESQVPPAARRSPPAPAPATPSATFARPIGPIRPVPTPAGGRSWHPKRVIIIACAIVAVIVTAIGLARTGSGPYFLAGLQPLSYAGSHVGDCMDGDFPNATGGVWPDRVWQVDGYLPNPVWQVPCDQPHTDEVFYVNATFWPASGSYPGDEEIRREGSQQCGTQFLQYVGVPPDESLYSYIYVTPDAQSWQGGDHQLVCVAYGLVPQTSIKGSDQ